MTRARTHKSGLVGAACSMSRCAAIATKFCIAAKRRDVPRPDSRAATNNCGASSRTDVGRRARLSSSKSSQADAATVGNHEFSVTQSGVEVVQDPELSKDDRPLWVAVEAFDLAVFEFEHVAARGVHLLARGRQLAKGKLQRAIVGALQGQLHDDDIAVGIDAI